MPSRHNEVPWYQKIWSIDPMRYPIILEALGHNEQIDSYRLNQNDRYAADVILKRIFMTETYLVLSSCQRSIFWNVPYWIPSQSVESNCMA